MFRFDSKKTKDDGAMLNLLVSSVREHNKFVNSVHPSVSKWGKTQSDQVDKQIETCLLLLLLPIDTEKRSDIKMFTFCQREEARFLFFQDIDSILSIDIFTEGITIIIGRRKKREIERTRQRLRKERERETNREEMGERKNSRENKRKEKSIDRSNFTWKCGSTRIRSSSSDASEGFSSIIRMSSFVSSVRWAAGDTYGRISSELIRS